MSRKTTPYARNRRHHARIDSITAANLHVTRLTPGEQNKVAGQMREIRTRLLRAAYTYADFVDLTTALHRTRATHDIGIVRDLDGVLPKAEVVLTSIGRDCEPAPCQWQPRALWASELQAIDDLVRVYMLVLQEITYGEWLRIEQLAVGRVRTLGGDVFHGPAEQRAPAQRLLAQKFEGNDHE